MAVLLRHPHVVQHICVSAQQLGSISAQSVTYHSLISGAGDGDGRGDGDGDGRGEGEAPGAGDGDERGAGEGEGRGDGDGTGVQDPVGVAHDPLDWHSADTWPVVPAAHVALQVLPLRVALQAHVAKATVGGLPAHGAA